MSTPHRSISHRITELYRNQKPTGILALAVYRCGHAIYYRVHVPLLRQVLLACYIVLDVAIVKLLCGAEFPARCQIGKHLRLPHGANGIVIHGNAVIGHDVWLFHQVTVGMKDLDEREKAPCIGDYVVIGAGAKILGGIEVGHHARIGANAVVIANVPQNVTAVGVPAIIKTRPVGIRIHARGA